MVKTPSSSPTPEASLEQRLQAYEQLHRQKYWPGSMRAIDYWVLLVLTVALVIGFAWWGGA